MHPFYSAYLAHLRQLTLELKSHLVDVRPDAIDWAPAGDTNSLAVLAAHVAGSLKYWLGDVISQRPSQRDREGEFRTQRVDAETLAAHLEAALDDVAAIMEPLTLDSLAEQRVSPRHGASYGVDWILFHALEHTAQHVGHAQLTRQLIDAQGRAQASR